jgi:hypothetical protein
MKRRTSSDMLIPVRFANFLSAAIWRSERNMEMRFIACIYVEHIFLSRTKRTHAENKSEELVSALLVNPQQNFSRLSGHFAGIARSRVHRKESRKCAREIA